MVYTICSKCEFIWSDNDSICPNCKYVNPFKPLDGLSNKEIFDQLNSKMILCKKCLNEFSILNSKCPICREKRDIKNIHKQ